MNKDRQSTPRVTGNGEGVPALWGAICRRRWFLLVTTLVCTLFAASVALVLPKNYSATVVVSPVTEQLDRGLSGLGSVLSQVGGLASMVGLSAPTDSMREESIATLQSTSLTERFIQANNLIPVLFASDWDPNKQKWKERDPTDVPTLWKASDYFRKHVRTVVENRKTGLVNVTVTWSDSKLAASWANELVRNANEFLREQAVRNSERNIAYLSSQAQKTDIVGIREATYSLMSAELRRAMLARGTAEYAFKVIDPAVVPEQSSSPSIALWIGTGALLGALVSLVVILSARFRLRQD